MPELPSAIAAIVLQFSSAFTRPTFARFVAVFVGVVVSTGRSTVHRIRPAQHVLTSRTRSDRSRRDSDVGSQELVSGCVRRR